MSKALIIRKALKIVPNTESIEMYKTRYGTVYYAFLKDGTQVNITKEFEAICKNV